MSTETQGRGAYWHSVVGGTIGLVTGVLGNLISDWLQAGPLYGAPTVGRLLAIVCLALLGILVAALLQRRQHEAQTDDVGQASALAVDRVGILWSRVRSRGSGIRLNRVLSVGSDIDIDTQKEPTDT